MGSRWGGYCVARDRNCHELSVLHTTFADHMVREMPHLMRRALEDRDLHALVLIDMHMQGRNRQVVVHMLLGRQPLGQPPRFMIVDVDERPDAGLVCSDANIAPVEPDTNQIANGLRTVGVAASPHVAVQRIYQFVVESYRNALHDIPCPRGPKQFYTSFNSTFYPNAASRSFSSYREPVSGRKPST